MAIHVRDQRAWYSGAGAGADLSISFTVGRSPRSTCPAPDLGLYIAREILRAHGGEVWVEGEPGAGSDFCVSLPVQPLSSRERSPRTPAPVLRG